MDDMKKLKDILEFHEREAIKRAIEESKFIGTAAKKLGISRPTLYSKMRRLKMSIRKIIGEKNGT